jgi:hypothetical protein
MVDGLKRIAFDSIFGISCGENNFGAGRQQSSHVHARKLGQIDVKENEIRLVF